MGTARAARGASREGAPGAESARAGQAPGFSDWEQCVRGHQHARGELGRKTSPWRRWRRGQWRRAEAHAGAPGRRADAPPGRIPRPRTRGRRDAGQMRRWGEAPDRGHAGAGTPVRGVDGRPSGRCATGEKSPAEDARAGTRWKAAVGRQRNAAVGATRRRRRSSDGEGVWM
jgi:hypothetical protein